MPSLAASSAEAAIFAACSSCEARCTYFSESLERLLAYLAAFAGSAPIRWAIRAALSRWSALLIPNIEASTIAPPVTATVEEALAIAACAFAPPLKKFEIPLAAFTTSVGPTKSEPISTMPRPSALPGRPSRIASM
ncbi:hypothetical protein D3C86_1681300 [compost metagenome]